MNLKNWENAKNILCVRLDNMGDVIMTIPAFRALKETMPICKLTLLTSSIGAKIGEFIPEIEEIIVADVPWIKSSTMEDSNKINSLIKQLKKRHFDAAIIFTVYSQNPLPSSLLCYLSDIPLCLAYCHENPYKLLTNWVPDKEPMEYIRHEVQRQIDLVKKIGCRTKNVKLSLNFNENSKKQILGKLKNLGVNTNSSWIIMHPGATSKSRQYFAKEFANIADEIISKYRSQLIFTGSSEEIKLIFSIQNVMKNDSYSLAGKTTMAELIALISLSSLFIGTNSGPMHIAAAVDTPVIVLYALTNPQHTPWEIAHRVFYFNVEKKYIYNQKKPLSEFAYPLKSNKQVVEAVGELVKI